MMTTKSDTTDRKRSPAKGRITFLTKTFGKPYAGNPHVRFEEAGEGKRRLENGQVCEGHSHTAIERGSLSSYGAFS